MPRASERQYAQSIRTSVCPEHQNVNMPRASECKIHLSIIITRQYAQSIRTSVCLEHQNVRFTSKRRVFLPPRRVLETVISSRAFALGNEVKWNPFFSHLNFLHLKTRLKETRFFRYYDSTAICCHQTVLSSRSFWTVSGMFQEAPNRPTGTNRPRGTQMIVVS